MRVEQLVPVKRIRKALPKTMDRIQTRIERIGSGVVDRLQTLRSIDAVVKAGKAVRRGGERTAQWARRNPAALPLIGLGGALTTWLLVRARRKSRQPKFLKRAMNMAKAMPGLPKGLLGRFVAWTLTPRKPRVFRAISIRW